MAAPTVPQLQQKLIYANKRVKFAWHKFYEATNADHHGAYTQRTVLLRTVAEDAIPTHIKNTLTEMATELKKKWECPVCMDMIADGDLAITNCGHFYCKGCLEALISRARAAREDKWECPTCRRKHKVSGED